VNSPVVHKINPQSNKFATGVENKVTSDSKHNDSPASGDEGREQTSVAQI